MKCKHEMPFGAECRSDGSTRFRLWAPDARSVAVHFSSSKREFTMSALDEGWFELLTETRSASQYQFRINEDQLVPDPASRFQPSGVHGASQVIDPLAFEWREDNWRGRPWNEAVIYELHVGTFSPEGTYAGAQQKLDYLADLGVTAIELMPLASFPGERDWGYDGVLPYAPAASYGRPDDLKRLVDTAHSKNLMVFLDVVYNHFGPEGNYLESYAPQFFTDRHHTPWGKAINFDGPCSRSVRDFFIHNALYWLEEYRFDGLRFDAVHAIADDSKPDILTELAETVHGRLGRERHIHLILENERNAAHYLRRDAQCNPRYYTAQWDDDVHHALHVLVTGEKDGYYSDYADNPAWHLGRCLAEGFSYQADRSAFRDGEKRGEPSSDLPPDAFVTFLQNHDQIGNRALGERIIKLGNPDAVRVAMAILLLAPSPPLLFMGEEFGAETPFLFFCDFGPELAAKVRDGRRAEFARFEQFSSPEAQARIPDANSVQTFLQCKLDWNSIDRSAHREWLQLYRDLLRMRRKEIVPLIDQIAPAQARFKALGTHAVRVHWPFANRRCLELIANFGQDRRTLPAEPCGRLLYTTRQSQEPDWKEIPALTAAWFLNA
jgi:malto-oligosyltrehalose trehalohydrolase